MAAYFAECAALDNEIADLDDWLGSFLTSYSPAPLSLAPIRETVSTTTADSVSQADCSHALLSKTSLGCAGHMLPESDQANALWTTQGFLGLNSCGQKESSSSIRIAAADCCAEFCPNSEVAQRFSTTNEEGSGTKCPETPSLGTRGSHSVFSSRTQDLSSGARQASPRDVVSSRGSNCSPVTAATKEAPVLPSGRSDAQIVNRESPHLSPVGEGSGDAQRQAEAMALSRACTSHTRPLEYVKLSVSQFWSVVWPAVVLCGITIPVATRESCLRNGVARWCTSEGVWILSGQWHTCLPSKSSARAGGHVPEQSASCKLDILGKPQAGKLRTDIGSLLVLDTG